VDKQIIKEVIFMSMWMTAQDIADELHISRQSVYDVMRMPSEKGGLVFYCFGVSKTASKRVKRVDFEKWLEGRKVK
jgi:predicted transcriptional regulator